jgi:hypothetical protein
MKTVWGVEWPIATPIEAIFVIAVVLLILFIFVGIRYYEKLKSEKIHDTQLFLFRLKRKGFSNFQIKIINNMVEILRLTNILDFLKNSIHFDSAAGKFLEFLKDKNESEESLLSICNEMTLIHDRLYYPSPYRKPLSSMNDIENGQILYFSTEFRYVYIGKVTGKTGTEISIKIYEPKKKLQPLSSGIRIDVFMIRIGDAEYSFTTHTSSLEKNILTIEMPTDYVKEKEFRHPYIDIILPCSIRSEETEVSGTNDIMNGTIFKLNEYEAVVRIQNKLNYRKKYWLDFEISGYKTNILTQILANRTVEEENILYYTLKFEKLSDPAKQVLTKFIKEHL